MGSFIAAGMVKPSESVRLSAPIRDGGGPSGGCTSERSGDATGRVPFVVWEGPGRESEMSVGGFTLLPDAGLLGDSGRAESR